MKKLLLIVVDALTTRVLESAFQEDKLPNLRALIEAGELRSECIAVFPSITPAATASIVTGRYPHEHGIAGAYWYDPDEDRVIYYGSDFWPILNQGMETFFEDFVCKLNHQRLRTATLFQLVERTELRAASLNYLVFRGDVPHEANAPLLLESLPGMPDSEDVYGPSVLYLGDFVSSDVEQASEDVSSAGGPFHRFGFDDESTAGLLVQMAQERALPDFTLAYFPDNDFQSHEVGPHEAVTTLKEVDAKLGDFIAAFDGLDAMLDEMCIVITGDHSQSKMQGDDEIAGIQLEDLLADFSVADAGEAWESDEQLIACPNLRVAQIYYRQPTQERIDRTVRQLLTDPRVDQVMWRADLAEPAARGYHVVTAKRGRLHFWSGPDGPHTAEDAYGHAWSWNGDLRTVDGHVSGEGTLQFENYPNAFERVASALSIEDGGHLWVTAEPGSEFYLAGTEIHVSGGSHGSLHALDSTAPLIVAGLPGDIELPAHALRSVDVAPLCLSVLELDPERPVAAPHIDIDA